MEKDIRVQTREICTNCTTGVVSSPVWEKYWGIWEKYQETFIDQQKAEKWLSSRINDKFDEWEKSNPYPECPEEEPCSECEGNRIILKWITLAEFKSLLEEVSLINTVEELVAASYQPGVNSQDPDGPVYDFLDEVEE